MVRCDPSEQQAVERAPLGRVVLALGALVALAGCKASVQGDASADLGGARADGDAELDAELARERATDPDVLAASEFAGESGGPALLGARRDLTIDPGKAPIDCACLKVALDGPNHPAFKWKSGAPSINEATQLVVGLSSDGVSCEHPKGSLGASYWGYKPSGNDIVVYVESLVKGRPLASGAVIPKPVGAGQVFVAPAFKRDPYGRGGQGEARCKLGNPGAARSSPPTPDEAGGPAPEG